MPLTLAQAENFVAAFFRDHRIQPPPVAQRKRFLITMVKRKRLNLPRVITRQALADQIAAQLCRQVVTRDKLHAWETEAARRPKNHPLHRPKYFKTRWSDFTEWKTYVRGVVVHQFGEGDGLQ